MSGRPITATCSMHSRRFWCVALKQTLPTYEGDELHPSEQLAELAAALNPEDVQLCYQTAILGRRDLAWAPDPRTGFEMTLLRMVAFRLSSGPTAAPGGTAASSGPVDGKSPRRASSAAVSPSIQAQGAVDMPPRVAPGATLDLSRWQETIAGLELGGAARQLAANCAYAGREGGLIRLTLDPAQSLLKTTSLIDKLSQALSRALGETVRVEIELAQAPVDTPARAEQRAADAELDEARRSLESDATIRGFKEKFGASLKTDSVKPH